MLILPKTIKSLNQTMAGKTWQGRYSRTKKDKEEWQILLKSELARQSQQFRIDEFAKSIHIIRIFGGRERAYDKDNLIGGCKALVDAMKGLLIEDDSPDKCNIVYDQVRGPIQGDGWTTIAPGHTTVKVFYG